MNLIYLLKLKSGKTKMYGTRSVVFRNNLRDCKQSKFRDYMEFQGGTTGFSLLFHFISLNLSKERNVFNGLFAIYKRGI